MPDTAVGGLVVQNGRQKGTRVPLRLPVTVVGTGAGCDVRLTAAGIGDVHCLIVATPAGPAVRSLFPGATRVNGSPTAAALLRPGDELVVGPCAFRLAWDGSLPAPAAQPETPAPTPPAAEFDLREREQALHEQEHQLAALLGERQEQVRNLLAQLADGREGLRRERAAVVAERADAKAKADEARAHAAGRKKDRTRTRRAAARLLKRVRAKCAADSAAAREERVVVERDRQTVAADRAAVAAGWERFRAEAEEYNARLQDAWGMVADAQDRLAAERRQTDEEWAHRVEQLDARAAEFAVAEQAFAADRRDFDDRRQAVRDELLGLEQRAAHLREAVDDLDRRRTELAAATESVPEALPVMDPVPLDWRDDRTADELMTLLQYRERELDRERKAAAADRVALDKLAGDLADGRAVLTEQSAALAAARREWQLAEGAAVADLEALARDMSVREQAAVARDAVADRADAARRDREGDLGRFQAKLERWQAALVAHETRFTADQDQADADLAARRAKVADREAELAEVCRVWGEVRTRERDELRAELSRWADGRERYAAGQAALDRKRQDLLADTERVAGLAVALEEARQEWEKTAGSPKAARRLRVLRARWESRFRRLGAELTRRRDDLTAEAVALDDRYRELHRLLADVAEKRADLADHQQAADRARLAARPTDDAGEPVILSLADARRMKGQDELEAVRGAAERMAAAVRLAEEGAGIVRLQPAA